MDVNRVLLTGVGLGRVLDSAGHVACTVSWRSKTGRHKGGRVAWASLTTPGLYLQGVCPPPRPQDPHKPFKSRLPYLPA